MFDIVWGCSDNGNLVYDVVVFVIIWDNSGIVDVILLLLNY